MKTVSIFIQGIAGMIKTEGGKDVNFKNARHEFKHSLNYQDYHILRKRLQVVLAHDNNVNQNGEYFIRSLYFDTPTDKALREKIDGVNTREKFRIRRYNDNNEHIMLEKKSKYNGLCSKQSVPLKKCEVEKLLKGDTGWMPDSGQDLIVELYTKMKAQQLRPKTIVDYTREPFVYPAGNVRITLDRAIKTGIYHTGFFEQNLPTVSAGTEMVVLEVKYDAFMPSFIAAVLQLDSRRASAISKYAICRAYG